MGVMLSRLDVRFVLVLRLVPLINLHNAAQFHTVDRYAKVTVGQRVRYIQIARYKIQLAIILVKYHVQSFRDRNVSKAL